MKVTLVITFFFLLISSDLFGQNASVTGVITNENSEPLYGVTIKIQGWKGGITSNVSGHFKLNVPVDTLITIIFRHIGYSPVEKRIKAKENDQIHLSIVLDELTEVLREVEIAGERERRGQVSVTGLRPKNIKALPSPFGDFNKILSTLPGVVSNNELSSTYSVRGGSFDENLVYVNDIPVYRPFLISSGQQEGLSFVNSDLVKSAVFSAGGWQPKYGDRLSSVLNVQYKEPSSFGASISAGLLGGSAHVEGKTGDLSYLAGARYKASQYLLNTMETEGEYLPRFADLQGFLSYSPDGSSKLELLASYARNRYLTKPRSRETEFGTFDTSYRFLVDFRGSELLEYDTYQGGLKYSRELSADWKSTIIASGVYAMEREFTDLEGGYRLCDVDKNPASDTFNECVYVRGVGSNYDYGRNLLDAAIINLENRNEIKLGQSNLLSFGLGFSMTNIDDQLKEYTFIDSAAYISDIRILNSQNNVTNHQYTGYIQHSRNFSAKISTVYGFRINYSTINNEILVSPRAQFSYRPLWQRDVVFTTAIGFYHQPPFYRELRDLQGNLNLDLKGQKSMHFIGGVDYNFKWWNRDFKLSGEVYYKSLKDVVIYDIDNVKVRYHAHNNAKAYVTGADIRVAGEFVEGVESWFSLGILNAREDVLNDEQGFIRRPTDQRVNLGVFFQDHLPDNPTFRVSLHAFFGSGMPFGPPQDMSRRNSFSGDSYRRVDIGFSKVIPLKTGDLAEGGTLIIGAEVLNLFGISNSISYTWITDVNNDRFAVPNSLSSRFLNLKLTVKL